MKALESHILVVEENYSFRGVYLVDTSRLGTGFVRSDVATVSRFELPVYLKNLEALAFVPDLSDDDYLGIMIMGSQDRVFKACRIPLGDSSKPVRYPCTHHLLTCDSPVQAAVRHCEQFAILPLLGTNRMANFCACPRRFAASAKVHTTPMGQWTPWSTTPHSR